MTDSNKPSASKLVIRIKVNSDAKGNNTVTLSSQENFKLSIEVILGILVAVLVISGLWYFFGKTPDNIAQPEVQSSNSVAVKKPTESVHKEIENKTLPQVKDETVSSTHADIVAKNLAGNQDQAKTQAEKSDNVAQKNEKPLSPIEEPPITLNASKSLKHPADTPVEHTNAAQEKNAITVKEPIQKNTNNQNTKAIAEKTSQPPTQKTSASKYVTRMVFANGIKNREPINLIEKNIPAINGGLKRIYCFTELHGLNGKTILHRWIYNNKLQAEIRFKVRGNRWRVNSSKRIVSAKQGLWQVDVVDQKTGKVLASDSFIYGE